jgi:hypothetical protein
MATRTIDELRKERDELRDQIERADRENNLMLQNGTIIGLMVKQGQRITMVKYQYSV